MKHVAWLAGLLLLALAAAPTTAQQKRTEPLVEKVKKAIDKGVKYLERNQNNSGAWNDKIPRFSHPGGTTCMALLALLNCGADPKSDTIDRGLKYLRSEVTSPTTYVRALQTIIYAEAGLSEDLGRIQKNVDHFLSRRIIKDGKLDGWSYDYSGSPNLSADNSNTQFVVLALYMAKIAGAKIEPAVWKSVRELYLRTQSKEGGWSYSPTDGMFRRPADLTMTNAGISGLLITSMALNPERDEAKGCGVYEEDEALARGLSWVSSPTADRFKLELTGRTYYNIYGIERVGRLSGQRFIGPHDWYREGCLYLVNAMRDDPATGGAYWPSAGLDSSDLVSTSFALLFLSKGRTPILVSKLAHGAVGQRHTTDLDWNNDRNDLRHLVEFTAKELFEKMPLAWQNFDMLRAATIEGGDNLNEDHLLDVASDMLQTPVVYITGHKSLRGRFRPVEIDILKRYQENGGFVLLEACCGKQAFRDSVPAFIKELYPDNELKPLPADHPVWTAHYKITPDKDVFPLLGIHEGCKTVLIYSPNDLSCAWESNKLTDGKALLAFRLGVNIIAYATGKEPPRPRLSKVEVSRLKDPGVTTQRGVLTVAQLEHGGDWRPAPRAMPKLMAHLRDRARQEVQLKTETLKVHFESIKDFQFIYMHGRREFKFDDKELEHLKFALENGALLFADACCGKEAFDKSFRAFMAQLFPDKKLESLKADDLLYSKDLNLVEQLSEKNVRCRTERGAAFRNTGPMLEGIKINGRWAVLYSKYDIGCALERHSSSDCLGYDHESALKIGSAAILYTLRP